LSAKPKSKTKAKVKQSVFERADMAGAYLALRLEALRSDPSVLAIFRTAEQVEASRLVSHQQRMLDADVAWPEPDMDDPDARAVRRVSEAAAADDAYRVQLLDLAAMHGGLYRKAVDALYDLEARSLGRWEAFARHVLDQRQIIETRRRDAEASSFGGKGDGQTQMGH
jgi:hypothetical protein